MASLAAMGGACTGDAHQAYPLVRPYLTRETQGAAARETDPHLSGSSSEDDEPRHLEGASLEQGSNGFSSTFSSSLIGYGTSSYCSKGTKNIILQSIDHFLFFPICFVAVVFLHGSRWSPASPATADRRRRRSSIVTANG